MADVGNSLAKAFDYVHGRLLGRLAGLGDDEYFWEPVPRWWQPIGPSFGPYARDSVTDLALHVFDEVVHHGAEVSLLRDLYLRKDQLER